MFCNRTDPCYSVNRVLVHWRWNSSVFSCHVKASCPASSTADKTVCQILSLSPMPASCDDRRSKMSVHACSRCCGWSVFSILITKDSRPWASRVSLLWRKSHAVTLGKSACVSEAVLYYSNFLLIATAVPRFYMGTYLWYNKMLLLLLDVHHT